ncbi:MAG: glycosyltransferase family 2 protein, partial [Candidatus Sericytochromatia bacterium]
MLLFGVVLLVVAQAAWVWVIAHYLESLREGAWLRSAFVEGGAPLVSIIVPARNEAHQIGKCVSSLLAQEYPAYEVIVVDDRSEDGTLEVLRGFNDSRLHVFEGAPLPEGWMGKSWANHQAVERARGRWLLFTDADTWHAPGALAATVGHAEAVGADLLSLFPFLECETFWEKLIQPAILFMIAATLPRHALEDPSKPVALANGQYL